MAKGGFPMGVGGNMQQLVKQAQRMKIDVEKAQEEIGNKDFEITVGGGAIKVVINGKKEFKAFTIDPACVDPEDIETLQDLVISAANEAIRTAEEAMNSAVEKITGGLNLGL